MPHPQTHCLFLPFIFIFLLLLPLLLLLFFRLFFLLFVVVLPLFLPFLLLSLLLLLLLLLFRHGVVGAAGGIINYGDRSTWSPFGHQVPDSTHASPFRVFSIQVDSITIEPLVTHSKWQFWRRYPTLKMNFSHWMKLDSKILFRSRSVAG